MIVRKRLVVGICLVQFTLFGIGTLFGSAHSATMVSITYLDDTLKLGTDYTQVSEDVAVKIPVLRNDYDLISLIDTNSLAITGMVPKNGSIEVNLTDGTLIYSPWPNFFGVDSFQYEVCTTDGRCGKAKVFVTVHAINDPPVIGQDTIEMLEDVITSLELTINDFDDGQLLSGLQHCTLIDPPYHGDIEIDSLDNWTYHPHENYFGKDFFYYSICDEFRLCDTGMVRLNIVGMNDPPSIVDDYDTTYQDLLTIVDPLVNDSDSVDLLDLDKNTLSLKKDKLPAHGDVYLDKALGMFIYVPEPDFIGLDSFSYHICDDWPQSPHCGSAVVEIVVLPRPETLEITAFETIDDKLYIAEDILDKMRTNRSSNKSMSVRKEIIPTRIWQIKKLD